MYRGDEYGDIVRGHLPQGCSCHPRGHARAGVGDIDVFSTEDRSEPARVAPCEWAFLGNGQGDVRGPEGIELADESAPSGDDQGAVPTFYECLGNLYCAFLDAPAVHLGHELRDRE